MPAAATIARLILTESSGPDDHPLGDVDDRGGHFAALEEPELLTDDIRTFFRGLR